MTCGARGFVTFGVSPLVLSTGCISFCCVIFSPVIGLLVAGGGILSWQGKAVARVWLKLHTWYLDFFFILTTLDNYTEFFTNL